MKHTLIFGASGKIGSSVLAQLEKQDQRVSGSYYKNKSSDRLLFCDVTDETSIKEFIITAKNKAKNISDNIDSVFISVGLPPASLKFEPIENITIDDFKLFYNLHVESAFRIIKIIAPELFKSRTSNIVLMGALSVCKSVPAPVHFATSKAALKGMVESLSKDFGKHGICINLIAPGLIEGKDLEYIPQKTRKDFLEHSALKRYGRPDEIASIVSWLLTKNTYITGQTILIDGGL